MTTTIEPRAELSDSDSYRLREWNATSVSWPDADYPALLAAQAARTPGAPALVCGEQVLSYAELDTLTNRVANGLIARGARPGARIGLCYPRGAEFVIGSIGIIKSGAAVVALDPVNPDERLATFIADATPLLVLTGTAVRIPGGIDQLTVDDVAAGQPVCPAGVRLTSESISHLIYTSGSTGVPKAVLERHGAITNLVHWTRRAYDVREGDRASWLSTPGFAVQLMEWLPYLPLGAAIHVPEPGQAQTPEQLRDWLVGHEITHTMLVAALAERTWGLDWSEHTALRIMVTTAERVHSWPPVDTCFRVVMTYGTTETTNVLSCLDIGAGVDYTSSATAPEVKAGRQVPVGRPIANLRVHLLDENDRPVPLGEVGRLHVAGAGLAAGYHDRPELTAQKFRAIPLPHEPAPVLYDTGDLARFRADGAVELLGRADSQVKIRGFRVELGEVETTVAAIESVDEAVVTTHEAAPGDLRLVAYVSPAPGESLVAGAIRAEVARTLPYYMVPSSVVVLPRLPRLANGKVDRRELPAPVDRGEAGYEAPRTEIEDGIAQIWKALFGLRDIGIRDNFFDLGGHSLLAYQMIDSIRNDYGVELSLSDLSAGPTVADLAELVTTQRATGGRGFGGIAAIVPDPAGWFEPFPLTESQQALWIGRGDLVELGNVGCHGYFEWQSEDLDISRFERAWRRLVERHDALRTIIRPDGTQQVLAEIPDHEIPVNDLTGLGGPELDAELAAIREVLSHQVIDADTWPLFDVRVTLLPGAGVRARIHLSLDFLIADAWSYFQVLVPDLVTFYEDPDADLAPLELTFRDYVLAMTNELRESDVYQRSQWYWLDRLPTLPPAPALAARGADEPAMPMRFRRRSHVIAPQVWADIQSCANDREVTPSGVLAAAFAEVLWQWTGKSRFTINVPLYNRLPLHPQVNELLGDTTTTLLLAVDQASASFVGRARDLQRRLWADLEHRYFSGVQVLRELTKLRGSLAPAMPVVMTSLAGHPPNYEQNALGTPVYGISQTPQVSLDFQVFEKPDGLTFNWDFLPVYPDGLIEEMFDAFVALLESLAQPAAWETEVFDLRGDGVTAVADAEPWEQAAQRDTSDAWERYWAGIENTGRGGDVLWDADSTDEMRWLVDQAKTHFHPSLPIIDLGCGNGRYSRELAIHFPHVTGVDVAPSAIDRAVVEAERWVAEGGLPNTDYLALDMTDPAQAGKLARGPYNIFVRGVFHVLDDAGRAGLASAAELLVGEDGVLIIHEPDYSQNAFGYVGFVGGAKGRAKELVAPLENVGVRHSHRFAREELTKAFDPARWELVTDDAIRLHAIDPENDSAALQLPGYYAVLRCKH